MDMITFCAYFKKTNFITFCYFYTNIPEDSIDFFCYDKTPIFCNKYEMVH